MQMNENLFKAGCALGAYRIWAAYPWSPTLRVSEKKCYLRWKAMGLIAHDRILNGEYDKRKNK